jgi:anti-sigma-K factor RskA
LAPFTRLRGLHVESPRAQVDERFTPAAQTAATRDRIDSGTTPWGWIAGGALAAALALVIVARALRRRRHGEVAPTQS